MNIRRLAASTRACSMAALYRTTRRVMSTLPAWTGARGCARATLAMQATRPPDERRARHEATGEWPQPSLSAMLAERVRRTPERIYLIEGRREGGRRYTFADLAARAERMAGALLGLGVRPGEVVSWQLPNWFEGAALAVAIDRVGAVIRFQAELLHPSPDDRSLLQFPLPHLGGIVMFVMLPIAHGSSTVFMESFDPELAVDLIERHRITSAGGPPAVLQAMFGAKNFAPEKVRSVRGSGAGAADVTPELMRQAKERFGGALVHRSYGMTECPMFTSGAPGDPEEKRFGTDGRPVPGCVARVVDEAGRPLGATLEGELQVYGPQLCVGYLDPALNVAFAPDGMLRTGDLAVMDDEGFIRITGRRKDIIIRKGENLSAKGIEDDLAAHPKVADVAVIGVPDAQSGERVCACVVLRPGAESLTLAEVRAFMEARGVMRQKVPEQLEVLPELPRNATGKVRKDALRARFRATPG